ncbi:hypothetical protein [Sansalvadorimonas verongulae]|uniref:hypothetical protein n=1 Tax=Sansalvadorimonas verongulae TaxID=2172824 RepID=UPI0012BBA80B|nr:hypothetical protein [Sansalvadorimonas verongulae]MTI15078.1 hypothetical protein [Sansalvadorimonas verongulae]
MLQCLRREPADHFRTRQVSLSAEGELCAYGAPLSFDDVQALRQKGRIEEKDGKRVFANLGVSLQLIVSCASRRALVLVEQRGVLKLVSGYVPQEHLDNPLTTAWAELMEEVLPFVGGQCHGFSVAGCPLPDPYSLERLPSLSVRQGHPLFESGLCIRSTRWPVKGYIHEPTASLQLVYPVEVALPEHVTLLHVEDTFDTTTDELLSILQDDSYVVLMALDENNQTTDELFTLQNGEWLPFDRGDLQFSEFFIGLSQG